MSLLQPGRIKLTLFIICVLLVPVIPFLIVGELPGDRWLEAQGTNAWAIAALGAGVLSADVLLPIPSSVVGVMLGARLGVALGTLAVAVGLTVGHCVGFWLGRMAPKRWCPQLPSTPSLLLVFLSRPVPIAAEAMTFAAGATGMPFARFLGSASMGNVAYSVALAAAGAALLPESAIGLTIVALLFLFVVPWWVWHRFRS